MLDTTGNGYSAQSRGVGSTSFVLEDGCESAPHGVSGQDRFRCMLSRSICWPLPTGLG